MRARQVDIRERIRVDGAPISKVEYLESFWFVYGRLSKQQQAGGLDGYVPDRPIPGFFRFLFLVATRAFLLAGVDVAILEVGLGGRLDATNVVSRPVVTAVTRLDYDHVQVRRPPLLFPPLLRAGGGGACCAVPWLCCRCAPCCLSLRCWPGTAAAAAAAAAAACHAVCPCA